MSNITGNFKVGDKIRFRAGRGRGRAFGRVREVTEDWVEVNYWREKRQRVPHYQDDHWLEHDTAPHAHPKFGGPSIGAVVAMVAAAAWLERRKTVSSKTSLRFDVQTSGIGWDSWQRCEDESSAVTLRDHYVVRELTDERTHRPWKWRAVATRTAIEVLP